MSVQSNEGPRDRDKSVCPRLREKVERTREPRFLDRSVGPGSASSGAIRAPRQTTGRGHHHLFVPGAIAHNPGIHPSPGPQTLLAGRRVSSDLVRAAYHMGDGGAALFPLPTSHPQPRHHAGFHSTLFPLFSPSLSGCFWSHAAGGREGRGKLDRTAPKVASSIARCGVLSKMDDWMWDILRVICLALWQDKAVACVPPHPSCVRHVCDVPQRSLSAPGPDRLSI